MNVLITGARGFIGTALYNHICNSDPKAVVWEASRRNHLDVRDREAMSRAVAGMDIVYHLAANTHVDHSLTGDFLEQLDYWSTNTLGTLVMLDLCREHGAKMVYVSTSEVYGTSQHPGVPMTEDHPLLPQAGDYAVSKAAADHACRMKFMTNGQDVVVARPFNQVGPSQDSRKLFPRFIGQALRGEPLTIYGDGDQRRDYVHVQDTARALWAAKELPAGTIVNIGTETSYSVNDIAAAIAEETAHIAGVAPRVIHSKTYTRAAEVRELNGSYQRLRGLTGWEPRHSALRELVHDLVHWYRVNGPVPEPRRLPYPITLGPGYESTVRWDIARGEAA